MKRLLTVVIILIAFAICAQAQEAPIYHVSDEGTVIDQNGNTYHSADTGSSLTCCGNLVLAAPELGGRTAEITAFAIGKAPGDTPLVKIKIDGTVEYGPEYNPDETARLFWESIGGYGKSLAAMKEENDKLRAQIMVLKATLKAFKIGEEIK